MTSTETTSMQAPSASGYIRALIATWDRNARRRQSTPWLDALYVVPAAGLLVVPPVVWGLGLLLGWWS